MTNQKIGRWALILVTAIGLNACTVTAVPLGGQKTKPVFPQLPVPHPPPVQDRKYWTEQRKEFQALTNKSWAFEDWTGNDAPYAAARAEIERAAAAGKLPLTLASQYEPQAKKEPNNPLAQFRWAYAVWTAGRSQSTARPTPNVRFAAELAIAEAPQPHTYNYDRLHYMIWIQSVGGGSSYYLRDLSVRLLKKDPNDFLAYLGQALIYTQHHYKEPNPQGYVLIQALLKKYPNRPEAYDALGCWYYSQYMFYHNSKNYPLAITYYQKAVDMYPMKSARRADLPHLMDFLTERYHQISGS